MNGRPLRLLYGSETEEEEECTRCWQPTRLNEQKGWATKTSFVPRLEVDLSVGLATEF